MACSLSQSLATPTPLAPTTAVTWIKPAEKGSFPSLGDLHMHTTCSDGENTYDEMAERALSKGFTFIAITDHNRFGGNGVCGETLEKCRNEKRLLCIPGIELSSRVHLVGVGITQNINRSQPIKDLVEQIHAQGGLAIAAHPYLDGYEHYTDEELFHSGIDAIECRRTSADNMPHLLEMLQKYPIPCVSNSGAHSVTELGFVGMVCDVPIESLVDLKAALKESRCHDW